MGYICVYMTVNINISKLLTFVLGLIFDSGDDISLQNIRFFYLFN